MPALYRGLAPALLRQATYGTLKFGLYYTIKEWVPGTESYTQNVICGVVAGALSSAIANPTDVLKVRMQSSTAMLHIPSKRASLFHCFTDIYDKEGVGGLWRGVSPNAQRAGVVAGVQLSIYDFAKMFFLHHGLLQDNAANHLISSFCAGLCACLASSPMDVVRTRMMNQRRLKSKSDLTLGTTRPNIHKPEVTFYRSSLHCAFVTVRSEGIRALYKGFVPAFMRMGPWNIIFFLVYEQLKKTF